MTSLHAYFHLRNQQAFQRLLSESADKGKGQSSSSSALSSSGGKSWNKPRTLSGAIAASAVNEKDWLGRTVLHLACASTEPYALEFARMLLAHPAINVNITDKESHWTALHRALYSGNIPAALLLLQRSDIDTSIKDNEGYTAFDLYNSTVQGTKPGDDNSANQMYELFTWGANRNASLGLGDGDDRVHPEQVVIPRHESSVGDTVASRFAPIMVKDIVMSKLHTGVVTSESQANLRLCGFGSGGRLGSGSSTQYSLKPLAPLSKTKIISIALGQDHTLAVTEHGDVLSWGLNRFGQLGYVIENVQPGSEPIQHTPKKILGPLKKDTTICGASACRMASACWSLTEVYTWGTNNGQLGYEKGQGPQINPRLVTKVSQPVTSVVLTDTAMACLLSSREVQLFWNGRHFKINFPQAFPSDISIYRPPQFIKDANVTKIVSCNETFAALSSNGEVFTFTVPNPSDADAGKERMVVKPQRVWALRKQFSAVRDTALGADGSLIVCTESGHVFVRERSAKQTSSSSKSFKFQRIPYLQRITGVRANATGSFGALRQEYTPKPIVITGNTLSQDMGQSQPWLMSVPKHILHNDRAFALDADEDEEKEDETIRRDIEELIAMCQTLDHPAKEGLVDSTKPLPQGADLVIRVDKFAFPVHSLILSTRSPALGQYLQGREIHHPKIKLQRSSRKHACITISGVKPLTVLLFLNYLYTDNIVAIWDNRISRWTEQFHIDPWQTRADLQTLSHVFETSALSDALGSHTKRLVQPTLARDLGALFTSSTNADVALQLEDHLFLCHSVILRARSAFFGDFFFDDTWTKSRWGKDGVITVQMRHLKRRSMKFVLRFIYHDGGLELFERVDFVDTLDEFLEFMFEVLAVANELLLTRLVDICSSILLRYVNISNACYLLTDATHYHAEQLISSLQGYISVNLELFLDAHMLGDVSPYLVKRLAAFVRKAQEDKSPITRSSILLYLAVDKNKEWLEQQDIPQPIVTKPFKPRSPQTPTKVLKPFAPKKEGLPRSASPIDSGFGDDVFAMDDTEFPPSGPANTKAGAPLRVSGWKEISAAPKADMKAIMEETARSQPQTPQAPKEGPQSPYRPPHLDRKHTPETPPAGVTRSPSAPWKNQATPSRPQIVPFPTLSTPQGTPPSSKTMPLRPAAQQQQQPGLGPTIQPTRQQQPNSSSSSQGPRRVSGGGPAWSKPPVQLSVTPTKTPSGGISLLAIQQSQLAEGMAPTAPRRSLREIQEEERARQTEADFLKWWEEEEERVRLETEAAIALSAAQSAPTASKGSGHKKPRKKPSEPRGDAPEGSNRGNARRGGGRGRGKKGPTTSTDP